jgi:hypothetical protein
MIFTQSLQKIDAANPQEAIKKMANHIKYIQEQLEYTLTNLDSSNINEIDIDKTTIQDSTGDISVGSSISISGNNGENFKVGKNHLGVFTFAVNGKRVGGEMQQMMYLNNDGKLVITDNAIISLDGGEW